MAPLLAAMVVKLKQRKELFQRVKFWRLDFR